VPERMGGICDNMSISVLGIGWTLAVRPSVSRGAGFIVCHDMQSSACSHGQHGNEAKSNTGHDMFLSHGYHYINVNFQPCVFGHMLCAQPRFSVSPCPRVC
jgi:hypothetical protein